MKEIYCFLLLCVAVNSLAYKTLIDGEQEYLLVPLDTIQLPVSSRIKRQTKFNFDTQSQRARLSHTSTLLHTNNHFISGTGSISKGIPKGPVGFGGNLDYTHKPTSTSFSADAQHVRGFGTDVGLSGRYNFINKPNTKAYVGGQYNRHLGSPTGIRRPDFEAVVGLRF